MAQEIRWLVEGHVMFVRINTTELEAYLAFDSQIRPILDNAKVPLVHVIFDVSEMTQMPGLADINKLSWPRHPHTGWILGFPKPNPIAVFMTSVMSQVLKARLRTFDTFEEALAFLQDVDQTLPDLSRLAV